MRGKRLVLVSHCVLNQNAVVRGWERAAGAYNDIVRVLLKKDFGILQLPCPEFSMLGEDRPPLTKEEYDTPDYRVHCRELAAEPIKQIREYIRQGYEIVGLLGIEESPSCDTLRKRGVFMEELLSLLAAESIELKTFDILEAYREGDPGAFLAKLDYFCDNITE
jgi:predicted secreted protein